MTDDDQQVEDLGRVSFRVAGQLRLLGERMTALSWQPDGHEPADLARLADALHGMALRCAMSSGNTALLNELSGRYFRDLDGDDPFSTHSFLPNTPFRAMRRHGMSPPQRRGCHNRSYRPRSRPANQR